MISTRTLAAHVLRTLAAAQSRGRAHSLPSLAQKLGVRRADVRSILTSLHREGHLDATTMRLTLTGFAMGMALKNVELPALRRETIASVVAA
jgi:DNA-binding IclR family transcriptional regulator